jgi:hypothetical protein
VMSVLLEQSVSLRRNPAQMFVVRPTEPISTANCERHVWGISAKFVDRHKGLLRGMGRHRGRRKRATASGSRGGLLAGHRAFDLHPATCLFSHSAKAGTHIRLKGVFQ